MDNRRLTVYSGRGALKKSLPQMDGVLRGLKNKDRQRQLLQYNRNGSKWAAGGIFQHD